MTLFFDISTRRSTSEKLCSASTLALFGFQSWHFFFGSLSSASILRFEELTQLLYVLTICWFWKRICHDHRSSMNLAFRQPLYTTSCNFRQPWLKTLPAGVFYLISNIWLTCLILITPPPWTSASICNVHVNIGIMSNAEMRARSSYPKTTRKTQHCFLVVGLDLSSNTIYVGGGVFQLWRRN